MKQFFTILSCLIVAMVAISCGNKVKHDIKEVSGDNVKVCKVKSLEIKKDFYLYTNEYSQVSQQCKDSFDERMEWIPLVSRCKVYMEEYGTPEFEKLYNENKAVLDSITTKFTEYREQKVNLENTRVKGKLYIAKIKIKDDVTGKYKKFYSYPIFSYDSDGTLHQIESDDNLKFIFLVYPKAKNDFKKAMGEAFTETASALQALVE